MRGTAFIAAFYIESCIAARRIRLSNGEGTTKLDALEEGDASKTRCRSCKSSSVAGFRPFLG